jgi:hypothetical protein
MKYRNVGNGERKKGECRDSLSPKKHKTKLIPDEREKDHRKSQERRADGRGWLAQGRVWNNESRFVSEPANFIKTAYDQIQRANFLLSTFRPYIVHATSITPRTALKCRFLFILKWKYVRKSCAVQSYSVALLATQGSGKQANFE